MDGAAHSTIVLPDGAKIAYEILGSAHVGVQQPIVLIGGMSSRRGDWERLATSLATKWPVLLFDHRGMGESTLSSKDDRISIESLARDLLFLLVFLQWKDLSICGFSMGGVVAQQLLVLPYLHTNPTPLPFRVSHVLLTGTLCSPLRDKRFGLRIEKVIPTKPRTPEEKREIARPTLISTFDPEWIANPANSERFEWWLNRMTSGRPARVILSQARAVIQHFFFTSQSAYLYNQMNGINFTGLHEKMPREMKVMVIHGELDEVVPFYCGQEVLQRIPWAEAVEIGPGKGQVESLRFGHHWYEYYDIQVWHDVIETFLGDSKTGAKPITARL